MWGIRTVYKRCSPPLVYITVPGLSIMKFWCIVMWCQIKIYTTARLVNTCVCEFHKNVHYI